MAVCTVTLATDKAAISGVVKFEPFPNQVIGGVALDSKPVTAEASGTQYQASLVQQAKYRIVSKRHSFYNAVFTCPAASTLDLSTVLEGSRAG
jgi:hypothetical protein